MGLKGEKMAVNCATIALGPRHERAAPSAERSFLAAYEDLKQHWQRERLAPEHKRAPQMMVALVSPDGFVRSTTIPAGQFRILGRHTQCALQLEDPDVSLRHLAIYWSFEGDLPILSLWDLQTGGAFRTEDGRRARAVVAERMLFGSIGRHTLLVVPIGPEPPLDDPRLAWAALPERRIGIARFAADRERAPRAITVTHTLPAVVFGGEEGSAGLEVGRIRVDGKDGSLECRVTEEQIERGLLFGRYERCRLSMVGDQRLSRVHLFVVRVGGSIWAVDTASTNGTQRNGAPITALAMSGTTSLLLGRECLFRWTPSSEGKDIY